MNAYKYPAMRDGALEEEDEEAGLHPAAGDEENNNANCSESITGSADTDFYALLKENEQRREDSHLLLFFFRKYCNKHRVSKMNSELLLLLSSVSGAAVPEIENMSDLADIPLDDLFPSLTRIDGDTWYLGARQLMALADLVRVESPSGPSSSFAAGRNPVSSAFSLAPLLSSIALPDMRLDCGHSALDRYSAFAANAAASPSPASATSAVIGGNEALCYLLDALRGHPSLREINLSRNNIGPWIMPALSRLIKCTPTLTKVQLSKTLLSQDEVEVIKAQCKLNKLRLAAANAVSLERWREHWKGDQRRWLLRQMRALLDEVRRRDDPPLIGIPKYTSDTPFLKAECTPDELHAIHTYMESHESDSDEIAAESDDDSCSATSDMWGEQFTNTKVAVAPPTPKAKLSPVLYSPHVRYYKTNEANTSTWSRACLEVLRCAFMEPLRAQMTFMCGRPIPQGVPGPLTSVSAAYPMGDTERTQMKEGLSRSKLLQRVRQISLPPPTRPQSIFGAQSMEDPKLRTSAEENFYIIRDTQEEQWKLLIDQLVEYMIPAYYDVGHTFYRDGDTPYWLYFVAPTNAHVEVEVEYTAGVVQDYREHYRTDSTSPKLPDAGFESVREAFTIPPGEFFGDAELLSSHVWHFPPAYVEDGQLTGGSRRLLDPVQDKRFRNRLRQVYSDRLSTATLRYTSTHEELSSTSGQGRSKVLVWQLPMEVALLYLYHPVQLLHQQQAGVLRRLPNLTMISPVVASRLSCIISSHVFREKAKDATQAAPIASERRTGRTKAESRIADGDMLHENIIILEEGDFILSTFTVAGNGKMVEQPLFGGNALVNEEAYVLDEEPRIALRDAESTSPTTKAAAPGALMGKEAALRQYRETKRRQRTASEDTTHERPDTRLSEQHSVPTGSSVTGDNEQMLCVGRSSATQWRYFLLPNADYFTLPQSVRLMLTGNGIMVSPVD